MTQPILYKNNFPAELKQALPRTKSNVARSIIPVMSSTDARLPIKQNLQRVALKSNPSGLPLRGCNNDRGGLVDHRLLTGKLGGWGYGSSKTGDSNQKSPHQGVNKVARQRVSLHGVPQALPGYLIKLVNQLMQHGKKGVSVGLLADSLTLFLKRLEERRRGNFRDQVLRSAILLKQTSEQALRSSEGGSVIEPHGVPSFPFSLTSFPGACFGEIFSQSQGRLNTLLGLPFSGILPPNFSRMRVSFIKREGKQRGLSGYEELPSLNEGKSKSIPASFYTFPFNYAPTLNKAGRGGNKKLFIFPAWGASNPISLTQYRPKGLTGIGAPFPERITEQVRGQDRGQSVNSKTPISGKSQSLTSKLSPTRVDVGLKFHTKRPIYFWPVGNSADLTLHSNSIKVQGAISSMGVVFTGGKRFAERGATVPKTSVLSYLGRAIANVEPSLEVRKKKVAGITRQIPYVVPKPRGERLAIRWIINSARERVKKRGKGLPYCLAEELIDAYHKRGEPRQRRDSLHKAAESNRSFLRYRWW